jgi:hypothetical protein
MPYTHEYDDDGADIHILPLVEDEEDGEMYTQDGHTQGEDCSCSPEVEWDEDTETYTIVHNYFQ